MSNHPAPWHFSGSGLGFSIDAGAIRVDKDSYMIFKCMGQYWLWVGT